MKLKAADVKRKDETLEKLQRARAKLEDAVSVYNNSREAALNELNIELRHYNEVLEEARGFADDIGAELDGAISNKSEKWLESDKGQAAVSLRDSWQEISLDEMDEVELGDELELDLPHADEFETLPNETDE